jgi:hypothetical protein
MAKWKRLPWRRRGELSCDAWLWLPKSSLSRAEAAKKHVVFILARQRLRIEAESA